METAVTRHPNPSALATAVVAPWVTVAPASAVHAAEPTPPPLQATRLVSVGLCGSDPISVATDLCVRRLEARDDAALVACRLVVRRARTYSHDPGARSVGGNAARRDYAYPLGNYAIAQTIAGDVAAAQPTTLLALQYAPGAPTLASNLAALEARRLAPTSTVSTVR